MIFAVHKDDENIINVLVVTDNFLLGDVLESLLSCESHLRVRRIMVHEYLNLTQEIGRHCPDVLVIEQILLSSDILKTISAKWQYYGRMRIIVISPHNNRIHVWNNMGTYLLQATDFVDLITNPSDC